jgi:chromosome segregation ATPase
MEDLRKVRGRFENRDAYATKAEIDLCETRARVEELEAELTKRAHQLSAAREAVVHEQASRGEAESGATWLATELARYKSMLDARAADADGLRQQVAHAEAEASRLRKILDAHGFSGAEAAVTLESDMEKVRQTAGVYDSIGVLPKLPGLEQLANALATAETETLDVTSRLKKMQNGNRLDFTNLSGAPAEAEPTVGDTSRSRTPLQ